MVVENAKPGQFIILRTDLFGERVPFTICDIDKVSGTVTILVQTIGATTYKLSLMNVGDCLADFVGPLGCATDLTNYERVLLVGGGIGAAVIYPQCKQLHRNERSVDVIIGARNENLLLYIDEFKSMSKSLYILTDDGSIGEQGFVTQKINELLKRNKEHDVVFAVGPLPMMRAVCEVTSKYGVKTIISMNSIMLDGTGMCGCCRLTVDNKIQYACIHGPEFDGHLVKWEEAIQRSKQFIQTEKAHYCRIRGITNEN
jgi:ferredoxin--NADP+ reductase